MSASISYDQHRTSTAALHGPQGLHAVGSTQVGEPAALGDELAVGDVQAHPS